MGKMDKRKTWTAWPGRGSDDVAGMTLPVRPAPLAHQAETLARRAAELSRAAKAANTRKAYAGDWGRFSQWCAGLQVTALPAAPATVGLYIAELVGIALEHLTEMPDGYRLLLPQSKGDRIGQGQLIGLPRDDLNPDLCPVRALKARLQAADIETGPVFFAINGQGKGRWRVSVTTSRTAACARSSRDWPPAPASSRPRSR